MAFLAAVFSAGLATRLPIGVLDLDSSDLSRTIIRMVDATPDSAVAVRVGDLAEGRSLILSGKIHGLLMLPLYLQRDVFAGRRPEVVFFYNTQTLTTGNLTARGVNAAVPTAAAGIRLAYYEKNVCVLERHTTIGGLNSFYRLRGRNYDVGLHAGEAFRAAALERFANERAPQHFGIVGVRFLRRPVPARACVGLLCL